MSFTKEPDNPTFIAKGNNVTLVWDHTVTDRQTELKGISWAAYFNNQFKNLIVELNNGSRVVKSDMPPAYTGRIAMKGRASLVIANITPQDDTFYKCALLAEPASGLQDEGSTVKIVVTGRKLLL